MPEKSAPVVKASDIPIAPSIPARLNSEVILNFGTNTRAALITRGLNEIMRLGVALGGQRETFMGLSGLGDLVLTCSDDQSRNRRFGLALGKGLDPEQAPKIAHA